MKQVAELVNRILENAFYNDSGSIDDLREYLQNYTHLSDGTEVVGLESHLVVGLADSYIEDYGKDAFANLLSKNETISSTIDQAACVMISQRALSTCFDILEEISKKLGSVRAPRGFKILKSSLKAGNSSGLDYLPVTAVVGDVEQYRNIEGSHHIDLYRESVKFDGGRFNYLIEVRLAQI